MLEEVLEKTKKELESIIQRGKDIQRRKSEIDIELQNTKTSLLGLSKENRSLSVHRKRNPIIEFFLKTFSTQYKNELRAASENKKKIEELNKKMQELRMQKSKLNIEEQTIGTNSAEEKLEKMKDENAAIQIILKDNPDLAKNPEFMKDLLSKDIRYIVYDKSDEPSLYIQYLTSMVQKLEENKEQSNRFMIDYAISIGNKLIDEIENPKEVEDGKYKIPHRYLFEALRKTTNQNPEKDTESIMDTLFAANTYLRADGQFPKEYGEKLSQLYDDKTKYLLMHGLHNSNFRRQREETLQTKDAIFREGLHSSTQGMACVNNLIRTTVGSYEPNKSFLDFIEPDYKIIIMLPREAIDHSEDNPVWGSDFPEADEDKPGYILPEYIYGFIDPETEKIEENTVPISERKKYKYHFQEGQTRCMKEKTRED